MKRILNYILILVVFSACQLGKDYVRPSIVMPAKYRGNDLLQQSNDSVLLPWKSFFTDPVLQNIIDDVLQRNHDMAMALKSIQINEEYLKESKVAWLPSVSAGIGTSRNYFSDNSLNGGNGFNLSNTIGTKKVEDYTLNAGVSWEIDIWGKVKKQKKAVLNEWLQSIEARKALQTRLIASAASSYYTLLMLDEQLAIARKNLALSDNTVKLIRIQFENGEATALALQQAEVQYKSTEAIIPDLEQERFIQENALNVLMGNQPDQIVLSESKTNFRTPEQLTSGVPASLMSNRPDVRQKEFELRAASARIGVAQAGLYPALNITAVGGLNSFQSSNWLNIPGSLFGTLAGGLTEPIFNKRKLRTAFNVSKITYEQKAEEFRKTVLQATKEVSDAMFKTEKLKEKITIEASKNELLQTAVTNADLLFTNGQANYLEVILVEQNLIENELKLSDLKRQQALAYIEFYRALGGGQ
ncbi:efflux transporter outer membrane subunit [Flavobacterium sp. SLB02]|uniref:efflux transporter outer membrane subunit n=1 Tax=Flavobacterium sp. SLB02 TaxID=2665645 RepID=UPI0012A8B496|nr:efflux transporter outer membrane subunit [Flavobacterium sp. SLB02]QGK74281.1 efflux transporter outer membrane subunit [Flavobacterium sp. SLB02]